MLLLPVGLLAPVAAVGGGLLLDGISTVAALSFRKLVTAYAGPCLQVRRSIDNAEQDIGFAASSDGTARSQVLDTASLLAFCGGGDGFASKWYEQSGHGNHATQTVAANQPEIVAGGAVKVQGGWPALDAATSVAWLSLPASAFAGLSSSTALSVFTGECWWTIGNDTNTITPYGNGTAYEQYLATSRPAFAGYGDGASLRVHTADNTGTALSVWRNGTQVGSDTMVTFTAVPAYTGSSHGYSGSVLSEVILTASALSAANRQMVERSMGAYYGVAVA